MRYSKEAMERREECKEPYKTSRPTNRSLRSMSCEGRRGEEARLVQRSKQKVKPSKRKPNQIKLTSLSLMFSTLCPAFQVDDDGAFLFKMSTTERERDE